MEKKIEVGLLLDFYGQLLTEKQQNIMQLYFDEDISLSEIGNIYKVSRQAVHDIINRSEKLLYEYEAKLKLLKQFRFMSSELKEINQRLKALDANDLNAKEEIANEIDDLIKKWEE